MPSTRPFDAIVAGHLCVDIYPDLSAFSGNTFLERMTPGRLLYVGSATFATGGPVSNTGQALHKLGIDVRLMGKIGGDVFGQTIRGLIQQTGTQLAEGLILSEKEGSSYTIILNPPEIDRMFLHYGGTNDTFTAEDIDFSFVGNARLFHFGYPPLMRKMYEDDGQNLAKIMQKAKEKDVITSLDMALPDPESAAGKANWEEILRRTLPFVDIFMPSFEEILFMADKALYMKLCSSGKGDLISQIEPETLSHLADILQGFGARIVGIKLGERGFYLRTGEAERLNSLQRFFGIDLTNWSNREIWAPCFRANLVGTAGSGDATEAGFLAALIRGTTIEDAARMAVAVGACCVEALDTTSGIQAWDDTRERIKKGWERHPLDLADAGWKKEPTHGHWESHGS